MPPKKPHPRAAPPATPPDGLGRLYTPKEAAKYLRLDLMTVYRKATRGQIPHHRLGRNIRFTEDDLRLALEPVQPPAPAPTADMISEAAADAMLRSMGVL